MACIPEEKTSLAQDDAGVEGLAAEDAEGMATCQRSNALRFVWGRAACISLTLLAAVLLSGAAAVAVLAFPSGSGSSEVESDDMVAEYAGFVPVFEQCGGEDYHGPKRCVPGCFCKKDNDFYSACKPPAGQNTCDKVQGLEVARKAAKLLAPLKHKAKLLKEKLAMTKKEALQAKKEYEDLENETKPLIEKKRNVTIIFNKAMQKKESADAAAASNSFASENAASKAKDAGDAEDAAKEAMEEAQAKANKAKSKAQFLAKVAGLPDPYDESEHTGRLL